MHELGLAQEILAIATERAQGASVLRVIVEVGRLSGVMPDALDFSFQACAEGTELARARLEVREVQGRARCRTCALVVELAGPLALCTCGSADLEWLSGTDLRLVALEVV